MKKRIYYTNGINEVRIYPEEEAPIGWRRGRVKSTATTTGARWYTDGKNNKLIMPGDIIPNGYFPGRKKPIEWSLKQSQTLLNKKMHYYTNGEVEILLSSSEPIPEGFKRGRLAMTAEQRHKLSIKHMGKKTPQWVLEKTARTKELNGTFNTSKPEALYKKQLYEKYGKENVRTNFKSTVYPYRCDFYIKSEDIFIELNLHWTHGGRPYDPDDPKCQEQLKIWQEKAKTSKFYQNAIETWTVRDVEKQKVAKKNKLNYITIYKL